QGVRPGWAPLPRRSRVRRDRAAPPREAADRRRRGLRGGRRLRDRAGLRPDRGGPGRRLPGIGRRPPRKPLLAAVEGFAVAGGCEIALACDLIVAARGARFGVPEVKRSLLAAGGRLLASPPRNASLYA